MWNKTDADFAVKTNQILNKLHKHRSAITLYAPTGPPIVTALPVIRKEICLILTDK